MSHNRKLDLEKRVLQHLNRIYTDVLSNEEINQLSNSLLEHIIDSQNDLPKHITEDGESWSENTVVMITYADTIEDKNTLPINSIHKFLQEYCRDIFEIVHILPFFPSSSDKGFSVKDYYSIYHKFGQWNDILKISKDFGVMADVVINHGSSEGLWFKNFIKGKGKGSDYFLNFDEPFDTSKVVRPRTTDLLNPVETSEGKNMYGVLSVKIRLIITLVTLLFYMNLFKSLFFTLPKGLRFSGLMQ